MLKTQKAFAIMLVFAMVFSIMNFGMIANAEWTSPEGNTVPNPGFETDDLTAYGGYRTARTIVTDVKKDGNASLKVDVQGGGDPFTLNYASIHFFPTVQAKSYQYSFWYMTDTNLPAAHVNQAYLTVYANCDAQQNMLVQKSDKFKGDGNWYQLTGTITFTADVVENVKIVILSEGYTGTTQHEIYYDNFEMIPIIEDEPTPEPTLPPPGTNIIPNPSFEEDSLGHISTWRASFTRSQLYAKDGDYSLEMTTGDSSQKTKDAVIKFTPTVKNARKYQYSLWYLTDSNYPAIGKDVHRILLVFNFYSSAQGKNVDKGVVTSARFTGDGQWYEISGTLDVDEKWPTEGFVELNSINLMIDLIASETDPPGKIYFDNIVFTPIGEPEPTPTPTPTPEPPSLPAGPNLIKTTYGFESATLSYVSGKDATIEASTEYAYEGDYSLKVTGAKIGFPGARLDIDMDHADATAKEFYLSVWYLTDENYPSYKVDVNRLRVLLCYDKVGGGTAWSAGSPNIRTDDKFKGDGVWYNFTTTFEAPADFAKLRAIELCDQIYNEGETVFGTVYYDNVYLGAVLEEEEPEPTPTPTPEPEQDPEPTLPPVPGNLIANPGFEEELSGLGSSRAAFKRTRKYLYEGAYSLEVTPSDPNNVQYTCVKFPLSDGSAKRYTLSVWYMTDETHPWPNQNRIFPTLDYQIDENTYSWSQKGVQPQSETFKADGVWYNYTVTFDVPEDCMRLLTINLMENGYKTATDAPGKVYYDYISLVAVPTQKVNFKVYGNGTIDGVDLMDGVGSADVFTDLGKTFNFTAGTGAMLETMVVNGEIVDFIAPNYTVPPYEGEDPPEINIELYFVDVSGEPSATTSTEGEAGMEYFGISDDDPSENFIQVLASTNVNGDEYEYGIAYSLRPDFSDEVLYRAYGRGSTGLYVVKLVNGSKNTILPGSTYYARAYVKNIATQVVTYSDTVVTIVINNE